MKNSNFDFEPICKISIKNIIFNTKYVLDCLNNEKLIAVVKSNAYGHGLEICPYIEKYCYAFAVSRWQEVVSLRYLGITKPIIILLPLNIDIVKTLSKYNVIFCCHSYEYAKMLVQLKTREKINVNIKIDSGMNRLGFTNLDEFESSLKVLSQCKNINLVGLYSHFAKGESFENCQVQYDKFKGFESLSYKYFQPLRHISASSGLIHKKFNLDAVRVGLMLYGYMPNGDRGILKPAMKIFAKSICNKAFSKNDHCLYDFEVSGGEYSLVNYGYADGLGRNFFPNRCMDLSFIKRNKQGVIMDDAQDLASLYNTIPYEILVNCSKRIKREYIGLI